MFGHKDAAITEFLIEYGNARVNSQIEPAKVTPVICAVLYQHKAVLASLLDNDDTDISLTDHFGNTAVDYALYPERIVATRHFMGYEPHNQQACIDDDILAMFRQLSKKAVHQSSLKELYTRDLLCAVSVGDVAAGKVAIDNGAEINSVTQVSHVEDSSRFDDTLYDADWPDNFPIYPLLINFKQIVYDEPRRWEHLKMLKFLLYYNADINYMVQSGVCVCVCVFTITNIYFLSLTHTHTHSHTGKFSARRAQPELFARGRRPRLRCIRDLPAHRV
jgi:hypothetical protein